MWMDVAGFDFFTNAHQTLLRCANTAPYSSEKYPAKSPRATVFQLSTRVVKCAGNAAFVHKGGKKCICFLIRAPEHRNPPPRHLHLVPPPPLPPSTSSPSSPSSPVTYCSSPTFFIHSTSHCLHGEVKSCRSRA